jgi:hypothetical protein
MTTAFRNCPRKFYNEFILGLRPPGLSIDLHAGGAFAHSVETVRREIFINHRTLPEALLRALAAFEIYWGDFRIPEQKKTNKTPERVWAAVESYFKMYPPAHGSHSPYFLDGKPTLEFTFAIPLDGPGWPTHPVTNDPFLYAGRFDLLGEYLGVPIVCDDKTSGQGHYANWSEKWDLRGQFIGYTWACRELGIDVDAVAVRGVGIQMNGIAHAEAIKPYSDSLRAKWLEQLRIDLHRIVEMWHSGYWDYNFGEACTNYGNCVFAQSCQSATPEAWLRTRGDVGTTAFDQHRKLHERTETEFYREAKAAKPVSGGSDNPVIGGGPMPERATADPSGWHRLGGFRPHAPIIFAPPPGRSYRAPATRSKHGASTRHRLCPSVAPHRTSTPPKPSTGWESESLDPRHWLVVIAVPTGEHATRIAQK